MQVKVKRLIGVSPRKSLRDFAALTLALTVLLLAGCATSEPAPAPAADPMPAASAPPPPPPAVPPAVSARLKVDTAMVQQHAKQFVAKPSTPPEAVVTLEPLTRAVNRSLAIMELHHRREGRYRAADVRAARTAADAVAHFLDAQPPPRNPAPE